MSTSWFRKSQEGHPLALHYIKQIEIARYLRWQAKREGRRGSR